MALFLFTKAIMEGNPIQVFNNGNMVRDFTYVDDIVEGVTRVIDNPPKNKEIPLQFPPQGEHDSRVGNEGDVMSKGVNTTSAPYKVYNIGNSSPVPLMEYIGAIEQALGKEAQKEYLPMQPGDVTRTV